MADPAAARRDAEEALKAYDDAKGYEWPDAAVGCVIALRALLAAARESDAALADARAETESLFRSMAPAGIEPLPSVAGLVSQINNMVAGMRAALAEARGTTEDLIRAIRVCAMWCEGALTHSEMGGEPTLGGETASELKWLVGRLIRAKKDAGSRERIYQTMYERKEEKLIAAESALAEAREVLRPFANAAACLDDDEHDSVLVLRWKWNGREVDIVNGDLRRAVAFLENRPSPAARAKGEKP